MSFQRARSAEQQDHRRAEILAAARALLEDLPLAGVSLRELARRVDLSKSNVVRYFPTREAVFLTLLTEDWSNWLDALERALPRPDRRRRTETTHALVASAVASTLTEHRRFCDLLAACQAVLEHNVPVETAREFKTAGLANVRRLRDLVRRPLTGLGEEEAFEFAGLLWALVAGAWPMANPAPAIATVLAEPGMEAMCIDFAQAAERAVIVLLSGLARPGGSQRAVRTPRMTVSSS